MHTLIIKNLLVSLQKQTHRNNSTFKHILCRYEGFVQNDILKCISRRLDLCQLIILKTMLQCLKNIVRVTVSLFKCQIQLELPSHSGQFFDITVICCTFCASKQAVMWCVGSGCVLILIKCVEQEQKIFKRSCETL